MFCDVACMATPIRVLLKYSHSAPHSRTVATMTESLSSAMTSLPTCMTPEENGVSMRRSSVPQIMPTTARSAKPSPIVTITMENCG